MKKLIIVSLVLFALSAIAHCAYFDLNVNPPAAINGQNLYNPSYPGYENIMINKTAKFWLQVDAWSNGSGSEGFALVTAYLTDRWDNQFGNIRGWDQSSNPYDCNSEYYVTDPGTWVKSVNYRYQTWAKYIGQWARINVTLESW
jgi:hypothetical protein